MTQTHTIDRSGSDYWGMHISLFLGFLSSNGVENNEVKAIVCIAPFSHIPGHSQRGIKHNGMHLTYCERLFFFFIQQLANAKSWPWNSLKPRIESVLQYLGPSPSVPKHFPSWISRVDRNVAVRTKDHDSLLSCFDFCAPPPVSQMFQTVGVLADLCFCSEMKGFCRSTWKRIYQGQEENSVICSV